MGKVVLMEKWPVLGRHERAVVWLRVWADLGRAPRTLDAYARGLAEYLEMCERVEVDPLEADRAHIASYVRELAERPSRRGANVVSIDSGAGLANATLQQRMVPVRLFYDFLVEEGVRESNPVGRGRYTSRSRGGGHQRGLIPRLTKLPWIPTESQWLELLAVAAGEPVRNRVMLALAYDAALRREELCSLRTDDLDPAHRMLRIRAETTKNRLERVVPYSAPTGVLLSGYLAHRATISRARGPLFLSESRRNRAAMIAQLANMAPPPDSVPINNLVAMPGTPLAASEKIDRFEFVRTIAAARITMPKSFVRLSAGREAMSEEMQAMCFFAGANSIF